MPSLIIFKLPEHTDSPMDDWDVLSVIDAYGHPGLDVIASGHYGYVYITDEEPDVVGPYLTQRFYAAEDNSADGGDVGDYDVIHKRKYTADGTKIAGPANKWEVWKPYPSNQAIMVTWAQALLWIEEKLA